MGIVMGPWASYFTVSQVYRTRSVSEDLNDAQEPTFRTSEVNITHDVDRSALSPGYFWLTPYAGDFRFGSYGPQIFDADGVS